MATSIFPGEAPDRPQEECAVFGVYSQTDDVARLTCFGLQALQHRGQESAGIAVGDGDTVTVTKDLGLVAQVFDEGVLSALKGNLAVGHCRYSTSNNANPWASSQPHISTSSSRSRTTAPSSTRAPSRRSSSPRASSSAHPPTARSPARPSGISRGRRIICARGSRRRWKPSAAPTPWCSHRPMRSMRSATRTASDRFAWASYPTGAAGSSRPRPHDRRPERLRIAPLHGPRARTGIGR